MYFICIVGTERIKWTYNGILYKLVHSYFIRFLLILTSSIYRGWISKNEFLKQNNFNSVELMTVCCFASSRLKHKTVSPVTTSKFLSILLNSNLWETSICCVVSHQLTGFPERCVSSGPLMYRGYLLQPKNECLLVWYQLN
jgi:hypothetical protein